MNFTHLKVACLSALLIISTQGMAQDNEKNAMTKNGNEITANNDNSDRTPKEDAIITQTMKKLIHESPTLSKLNVHVVTKNGVIHLNGTVDSDTHFESLVEHAQSIIGVEDVNTSELKVKDGKQPLADSLTTARIKGLLIREKLFGEKDIAAFKTSIETKDGVVYISGVADNKEQIQNAIDIIKKSIPGIKKVEYSVHKSNESQTTNNSPTEDTKSKTETNPESNSSNDQNNSSTY